jgi:hypothetical protein
MKKRIFLVFLTLIFFSKINGQEYSFINEVITPYEKNNSIPLDSIFLREKFINLKNHINLKYLNEETIKLWWNNGKKLPPVDLFLKNFDLSHFKAEIKKTQSDSIIDFESLEKYFYCSNQEYVTNNPKKKYLSISKPFFNFSKDWCVIVKSQYIPYTNTGGSGVMYIYVKVQDKWILYNIINIWLS